MTANPSQDALLCAAAWLDSYDEDGSNNRAHCLAVAKWLRTTAKRQIENQAVAEIVKRTGATRAHARTVYRRIRADYAKANRHEINASPVGTRFL